MRDLEKEARECVMRRLENGARECSSSVCHLQVVQLCSATGRVKPLVLLECSSSACLA